MIGHQDEVARREEGVPCVHLAPALRNRLARRRELHVPARAGIAPRRAAAPRGLGGNLPESLAPGRARHDARKERLPPADRGGEEKEAEPALVEFQVHARDSTRWSRRRQSRANDRGLRPRTPGASTAPPALSEGITAPPPRSLAPPPRSPLALPRGGSGDSSSGCWLTKVAPQRHTHARFAALRGEGSFIGMQRLGTRPSTLRFRYLQIVSPDWCRWMQEGYGEACCLQSASFGDTADKVR